MKSLGETMTNKFIKKTFVLLLAALISLPNLSHAVSAASVEDFTDLDPDAWYYSAISEVVEKGIFAGTSDTTFDSQTPITRGMFVQIMANFTENYEETLEDYNNFSEYRYFKDVPAEKWYGEACNWAYVNLIVTGTDPSVFSGDIKISREEAATILYNYAMRTGCNTNLTDMQAYKKKFKDADRVSDWAQAAVCWATETGVMRGVYENELDPRGTLTRGQAASLIQNMKGTIDETPTMYSMDCIRDEEIPFASALGMSYAEMQESFGQEIEAAKSSAKPEEGMIVSFEDTEGMWFYFDSGSVLDGVISDVAVPIRAVTALENIMQIGRAHV